jgi:hypothetical protein
MGASSWSFRQTFLMYYDHPEVNGIALDAVLNR